MNLFFFCHCAYRYWKKQPKGELFYFILLFKVYGEKSIIVRICVIGFTKKEKRDRSLYPYDLLIFSSLSLFYKTESPINRNLS